jgi:hypothetical protein
MAHANEKQQAHQMLDKLDTGQLEAVLRLLRVMTDPVARAIASAPVDDEPESEQERRAVFESKSWFEQQGGKGISHEDVLAEFGLTPDILKNRKDRV